MDWYEAEVRQLEKRLAERTGNLSPAVFYGSSSIRLWEHLADDLADASALNAGFGGSTLAACEYFFDRLVGPLKARSLTVYAGDNDLADGQTPEAVLGSFRGLAAKVNARFPGIPFGYISIKPSPARFPIVDKIQHVNKSIEQEIELHPNFYFIPVFDAMLTPEHKARPELFLADGLHMGPLGYKLWTQFFEPYRNRMFPSVHPFATPIGQRDLDRTVTLTR